MGEVDQTVKIVIVGDGAVGKTCMLLCYTTKKFPPEYEPTIFDNYSAVVNTSKNGRDRKIKLMLFDTAGQEDYKMIRPLSYPQTSVFIVCYAVDSKASFSNIKNNWIPEITAYCPGTPWILCGTKKDLEMQASNPVSESEAEQLCQGLGGHSSMRCSALMLDGLKEVFDRAISVGMGDNKSGGSCCVLN